MNIADYRAAIPIHKNAIAGRRDFEQMKIVWDKIYSSISTRVVNNNHNIFNRL